MKYKPIEQHFLEIIKSNKLDNLLEYNESKESYTLKKDNIRYSFHIPDKNGYKILVLNFEDRLFEINHGGIRDQIRTFRRKAKV